MIRLLVKAAFAMLALAALLYGTFFVPLGRYTVYAHLRRIAETEEARELGAEVSSAVDAAAEKVAARIGNPAPRRPD